MQLTIHRGANQIGGSCVEVTAGSTRLILDVGLPLFDADRQPIDNRRLRWKNKDDLLAGGTLPSVPGLFDDQQPSIDGILLSHAHLDHVGMLEYSNPQIPVYASRGTSKMMLAGALFAGQSSLPRARHQEIVAREPIEIGPFQITPYSVDHSIYGSMAFLIEADGKSLLYSGDLRLHGRKPGMAKVLLDDLKDRTVDMLLMEGTHFGSERGDGVSEYELEAEIAKHVAEAPSLVLASFSPQHLDRLVCFIRAAKNSGRVFVVDVYTAYVLYLLHREVKSLPLPTIQNGFRVFFPKYFEASYGRKNLGTTRERFVADRITMDDIRKTPEKYLMVFRASMSESDFENEFPVACSPFSDPGVMRV